MMPKSRRNPKEKRKEAGGVDFFSLLSSFWQKGISRRAFLKGTVAGLLLSVLHPFHRVEEGMTATINLLYWVKNIPSQPFQSGGNGNYHAGVERLLQLAGNQGLKFYRSSQETVLSGPSGLIEPGDVVLIKVNAQWKYRGCTNSDLIRGLIQRILDHPDGFTGEVVIFENGQGQGSLNGDALGWGSYPDNSIHANANDESHSFLYLIHTIFDDPRVSGYLLDPIRGTFIGATDHVTNGYRIYENVSYPCFTTAGGQRVELREGIWNGSVYSQNLKLINVPVLKVHGGSEITASLKHFYGVVSMSDGQSSFRHYSGLGETCGKMVVSVRTPVLNIIDAIWVSHSSVAGYPASTTFRANEILASQDPVALDYWATKYILYPITNNPNHLPLQGPPSNGAIDGWLTSVRDTINGRGGLYNLNSGILVGSVTKDEGEMSTASYRFYSKNQDFDGNGKADVLWRHAANGTVGIWLMDGATISSIQAPGVVSDMNWQIKGIDDFNGDGKADILWHHATNGIVGMWIMDGAIVSSVESPGIVSDTGWQIKGVGDFNADGKTDILWQHSATGQTAVWLMDGATISSVESVGVVSDPNWQIKGIGDFNGDGKADVLWHHATSGNIAIWFMDGAKVSSVKSPGVVVSDLNWQIKGVGDFNGDGMADILWYHTTTGWTSIWIMNGEIKSSYGSPGRVSDLNWQIKGIADFNGDRKTEVLWHYIITGQTAIWFMDGINISSIGSPGIVSDLGWEIMH